MIGLLELGPAFACMKHDRRSGTVYPINNIIVPSPTLTPRVGGPHVSRVSVPVIVSLDISYS